MTFGRQQSSRFLEVEGLDRAEIETLVAVPAVAAAKG